MKEDATLDGKGLSAKKLVCSRKVKTVSIPVANTAITRNVTDLTELVLLAVHMDSMDKSVTKISK